MFETAEKRVNRKGGIIYWENGVIIGRRCGDCGKDKEINEFTKVKRTNMPKSYCKECERIRAKKNKDGKS